MIITWIRKMILIMLISFDLFIYEMYVTKVS